MLFLIAITRRQIHNDKHRPGYAGASSQRGILLLALVVASSLAASGLLAACSAMSSQPPKSSTPTPTTTPASVTPLKVSEPRVPTWPVEALDRIDFSVDVANPSPTTVHDVTLELIVTGVDGSTVLDMRQSGLTLQPGSSQAVYWQWRIPGDLAPGSYKVGVRAFNAAGHMLSEASSAGTLLHVVAPSGYTRPTKALTGTASVSPYLCGANVYPRLADSLTAAKQMGVTTIRLPPDSYFSRNLKLVKEAGLQPLIILHGSAVSNSAQRLAMNEDLVREAQRVFGADTRIFYEIGNENDLESGLTADDYVAMWNALVPKLKQIAPNSWFGGPVNFQANPPYVAHFVHGATPKPDFISWHEYTCSSQSTGQYCIQRIAEWSTHIRNVRSAIQANGDSVPPIMITEWNYAPDDAVASDTKHNDPAFMAQWTTTALQALSANQVYAAYQFNVSSSTPLLNSPQGEAFTKICQSITGMGEAQTPPPTPTVSVSPTSLSQPSRAYTIPGPVIALDTFQRSDQAFWGTASDGERWSGDANTNPVFSIWRGIGRVTGGNGVGVYDAILGSATTDAGVLFTGSMSSFLSSNIGVVLRWNDTNNWYKAYIDGSDLVVQKRINGSYVVLGTTAFSTVANTNYSLRFQVVGTKLSAKVWPTGSPEPSAWMVTATDNSLASGKCGLRAQVGGDTSAQYAAFTAYTLSR